MGNIQKMIAGILGIAAIVSLCFGAVAYFATADELIEVKAYAVAVEKRLDQKIVQDRVDYLYEQSYKVNDWLKKTPDDPVLIDRQRRLQKEVKESEKKLEQLSMPKK